MEESKILVVDDNKEIREIINILLSGEGYQVIEANDGLKALDQIMQHEFDLIILDVMMPKMNGYQTCLEIDVYKRQIMTSPVPFQGLATIPQSTGSSRQKCLPPVCI